MLLVAHIYIYIYVFIHTKHSVFEVSSVAERVQLSWCFYSIELFFNRFYYMIRYILLILLPYIFPGMHCKKELLVVEVLVQPVAQLVQALRYRPEGSGFDSR